MLQPEGLYPDAVMLCGKREKELEGIPVGSDGVMAHPPDVGEIMIEELMDARGELHIFHFCQTVKS